MDWIAFASVVSSATVALATLGVNAWTRRGDREHAAALDYEQRVWEAKSAALIELIGVCDILEAATRPSETIDTRTQVLLVGYSIRARLTAATGGPLVAYGSRSVRESAARLREAIESEFRICGHELRNVEQAHRQREQVVPDIDGPSATMAALAYQRDSQAELNIKSTLDVAVVKGLCATLIERARADLRGPTLIERARVLSPASDDDHGGADRHWG